MAQARLGLFGGSIVEIGIQAYLGGLLTAYFYYDTRIHDLESIIRSRASTRELDRTLRDLAWIEFEQREIAASQPGPSLNDVVNHFRAHRLKYQKLEESSYQSRCRVEIEEEREVAAGGPMNFLRGLIGLPKKPKYSVGDEDSTSDE